MYLRKIAALHFGPFENETLELAPGLTVVWGPNEAGKSSWHSAITVTLGGARRKRGAGTKAERAFEQRHRPWRGGAWALRGELQLDDGRLLEITHDLDAKTGTVRDLDIGTDLTNDFLNDGGIDICRLAGLDRASFVATACVRQADLFAVRDDAEILQEHMQRAAATAGTDATAAAALDKIAEYRREAVGLDRANSQKPLRRAISKRQEAMAALNEAETHHEERLELVKQALQLEQQRGDAQQRLRACARALALAKASAALSAALGDAEALDRLEIRLRTASQEAAETRAAIARTRQALELRELQDAADAAEADAAEIDLLRTDLVDQQADVERLQREARTMRAFVATEAASHAERAAARASELAAAHPEKPVPTSEFDAETARAIAVLEAWKSAPEATELSGTSAEAIEDELRGVPEPPVGDTRPRPSVEAAAKAHDSMQLRLESHERDEPATPVPPTTAATEDELNLLADELALPMPAADTEPADSARDSLDRLATTLIIGGAGATAAGIALAILVAPVLAAIALVGAVVLVIGTRKRAGDAQLRREMDDRRARHRAAEAAQRVALERRSNARARAETLGLDPDPLALRVLASQIRSSRHDQRLRAEWEERRTELLESLEESEADLRAELLAAGVEDRPEADQMLKSYRRQCDERAEQLRQSKRRADLESQLELRRGAEDAAVRARLRREETLAEVVEVARAVGINADGNPVDLVRGLEAWLAANHEHRARLEVAAKEWSELRQILQGASLAECQQEADRRRQEADQLSDGLDLDEIPPVESGEAMRLATEREREIEALQQSIAGLRAQISERHRLAADPVATRTDAASALARFETGTASPPNDALGLDPHHLPDRTALQAKVDSLGALLADAEQRLATAQGQREEQERHVRDASEAQATVEEATAELLDLIATAPHLESEFGVEHLRDVETLERERAVLVDAVGEAESRAAAAKGQLQERTRNAPDLPAAKEVLADAEVELQRVQRLQVILDHTSRFLESAQERVHRDIAPHLRDTVQAWLPLVFAGRYDRVVVDPVSLDVQLGQPNGDLRSASLLSHGTGEQIYLLLRVSLVEHLTSGETCPLLLDEVTAHADDTRSARMLDLLHQLSVDRQIVVFSQESRVRDWAAQHLAGDRDRLVELAAP